MGEIVDLIIVGLFLQTLTMIAVFMNTGINIVYRLKESKKCQCKK